MSGKLATYQNGNAIVEIHDDGTRVITTPDSSFNFDYPLNIDIRVSTKCSFGRNPETGKGFCGFCHESSTTDGVECDYKALMTKLEGLPKGIELAVGCNELTSDLYEFILWCSLHDYIVNLTINQGHIMRDYYALKHLVETGFIRGLGVSYRSSLNFIVPEFILEYPNTVFHVIVGIDDFNDVLSLKDKGVKKLLCLGEKSFGFNKGNVDLDSNKHRKWYWYVKQLFHEFDVVSFDNLALEQLNIRRFLTDEQWEEFNQGEKSLYVDAVHKIYKPSSRSIDSINWDILTIKEYFQKYVNSI
jgi:hypothetical protein